MAAVGVARAARSRSLAYAKLPQLASCVLYGICSRNYDVTPDGLRFLMLRRDTDATSSVTVVQHWAASLGTNCGAR